MGNAFRAAIIGTGRIASSLEGDPLRPHPCTHAGHYVANPRVTLVAGSDTDSERLAAFGERWNLPQNALYPDYTRMLDKIRPNIVSVCAYAPQRLEMCQAAIEYGAKALWIEKALGCSLYEAEAIREAVHQNGVSAAIDYPRRLDSRYRAIKKIIDERQFGRLHTISCYMTHQLIHTGTHAFDILRYWCGEATSVRATLDQDWDPSSPIVDQGGRSTIEMSSGATAFVSASPKKYYIFQFDLIFEKARIQMGNDVQRVLLPDPSVNYTGYKELFDDPGFNLSQPVETDMLNDILNCVSSKEEPISSVNNAIEALKIGLAHFESHRRDGAPVDPQQLDRDFKVESV